MKELNTQTLIETILCLQQLLSRLLDCLPKGAAQYNFLIQHALSIVAAESASLYVAIADGMLNLVDKFFEMQRHDAVRALEIYRRAGDQAVKLSEFFEICRNLDFGRGQKYVKIEKDDKVQKWRAALEEAANLSGWDLPNTANAHEARVINQIVEDIMTKLGVQTHASNAEDLVGIESHMQKVYKMLQVGSAASISSLTRLKVLALAGCRRLEIFPELPPSIEKLYADECTSLKSIDQLTKYPMLRTVSLRKCHQLLKDKRHASILDSLWKHMLK
ncbi:hypothetical protein K7X08_021819 [Anisodus acutangulus]|uniref:AP180 N-terminal homology (ANTH) domain-containing protein n=1 Tax=Anisodus acutangulus TaxID=402998 RepID=A0A9Q1L6F1_9SOLA|nr:hypothetical protein K7X08_021819 [Anisodus acutangulus]